MKKFLNPIGVIKFNADIGLMLQRLRDGQLPKKENYTEEELLEELKEEIGEVRQCLKIASKRLGEISHQYRLQSIYILSAGVKEIDEILKDYEHTLQIIEAQREEE
ncbi:hypothetical protein [Nitrosophilus labii]|uniref:hypothetical protein n=1 Tax=Nitrosophilus labii TaxID=2706014 RepID=UPI001656AA99|nr:hypothetical protein [Nitrosophilus labii]